MTTRVQRCVLGAVVVMVVMLLGLSSLRLADLAAIEGLAKSSDHDPMAAIKAIREAARSGEGAITVLLSGALAGVVVVAFMLYRSVARPLRIILETLRSGDRDSLMPLVGRKSAFGMIASLIQESLRQRENLERELDERRRAEAALAAERELFRTLIDTIPDEMYVKDTAHRFAVVNPAVLRAAGRTDSAEMLGKDDAEFLPAEAADRIRREEEDLLRTGQPLLHRLDARRDPGTGKLLRAIAVSKIPLRDRAGAAIGIVGIHRDVTAQKVAEEELRAMSQELEARVRERTAQLEEANAHLTRVIVQREEAELAYRASEERLRTVISNIPVFIFALDAEGTFRFAEGKGLEGLGRRASDMAGRSAFSVYADSPEMLDGIRRALAGESCVHLATMGGLVFETAYAPEVDAGGRIVGAIGVASDVTARHQAESALRASEDRYRGVVENIGEGVTILEPDESFAYANRTAEEIFGVDRDGLTGRSLRDFVELDHCADVHELVQRPAVGGRSVFEIEILRKGGDRRFLLATATRHRLPSGAEGTLAILRDITLRREAEEILRESEERLRWAQAVAHVGNWELLPGSSTVWASEEAFAVFGLPRMAGVIRLSNLKPLIPPQERPGVATALLRALRGIGEMDLEFRILRPDGGERTVHCLAHLTHGGRRSRAKLMGVLQDITSRKKNEAELRDLSNRLEERVLQRTRELAAANDRLRSEIADRLCAENALRKAKALAEDASRAKSEFLANMSHEIRTPMNGVLGMTELALQTDLSPRQQKYLAIVRQSAEALLTILNDILDFSKIEAGKMKLEHIPFNLRDAISDTLRSIAAGAHAKSLELVGSFHHDVPAIVVGDPGRLNQVIINLVGNAIKFTDRGEVVVRVRRVAAQRQQVTLKIDVTDTGIGIPRDKQREIFQAFTQADVSTTRRYGGTGLGLAICSQLVALMNGRIGLESEVGRGSTFSFTVTLALPEDEYLQRSRELTILKGVRVLVMDNKVTSRNVLQEILSGWQMDPTTAASVEEAQVALQDAATSARPFLFVLVDSDLAGADFPVVEEPIPGKSPFPRTTIIVLSATTKVPERADGNRAGISLWLEKPVKPSELCEVLLGSLSGVGPVAPPAPGPKVERAERPMRILLVEDNRVNQELALGLLELAGHEVTVAATGREAVECVAGGDFDLVLMDVQMPEMDGFAATAMIRAREQRLGRHTPIVAMTAHAMQGDRERCLEAGMDGYVSKPIRSTVLFETLQRVLRDHQSMVVPSARPHSRVAAEDLVARNTVGDRLPVFESEEALSHCLGNPALLHKILVAFLDHLPRMEESITQALAENDREGLTRAAHTLKGAAGNIAACRVLEISRMLEEAARENRLDACTELVEHLERETLLLERAIHSHLESTPYGIPSDRHVP